jgi:hypothetical protein
MKQAPRKNSRRDRSSVKRARFDLGAWEIVRAELSSMENQSVCEMSKAGTNIISLFA